MLILVSNYVLNIKSISQFNILAPLGILNYTIHLLLLLSRLVLPSRRQQCIKINWILILEILSRLKKVLYLLAPFRENHSCSWIQVLGSKNICPSLGRSLVNNENSNMNHTPLINHSLVVEILVPEHHKALLI